MAEFPCLFSSRRPTRLIPVLVACGFLMTVANASANTFLRVSIGNLACGVLAGVIGIGTTFLLIGGIAVALQGFILAECLRIDPIGPVQA
ncbi:hypothetical protein [Telmatospirillum sp.]|uniref:hypothetical protein n=1 Tax=Telmatospirillum sp. TaxID=2079197 RepID=UPI00284C4C3C|nr:hypothetical protein [Telmatospirillum sp.]MDR3437826.1 hypothetical protein [Telmatospirillum sp.]